MSRYMQAFKEINKTFDLKSKVVIDCASGDGLKILDVKSKFDIFPLAFDIERERINECIGKGLVAAVADICKLIPVPDLFCDIFISSETLEHLSLEETKNAINEIRRVTKEYIIITVPSDYKICMKNPLHKQYLSYEDLVNLFYFAEPIYHDKNCRKLSNSDEGKERERCNRIVIFKINKVKNEKQS